MSTPTKKPKAMPARHAYTPPHYTQADVCAIQALNAGTATPDQQQRALRWMIEVACATYDLPYRPESARDTDFACGRMFVGQQVVKLVKMSRQLIDALPE